MGATRCWKNWHRSRQSFSGIPGPKQSSTEPPSGLEAQCGDCSVASCHGSVLVMSTLLLSSALVVFHSCWYLEASSGCTVVSLLTGIWPSKPVRAMERAAGASHGEDAQWLVVQAERNGTNRCDDGTTGRVQLFGLPIPRPGMPVQMESGIVHELLLVAFMENGTRRCGGGDFFETALTGVGWRSRPLLTDLGDGSYLLRLHVPKLTTGLFSFKAVLLFGNLHGLDLVPDSWVQGKELLRMDIHFVEGSSAQRRGSEGSWTTQSAVSIVDVRGRGASAYHLKHGGQDAEQQDSLRQCADEDFQLRDWKGRWTRSLFNDTCVEPDSYGHFRCLPPNSPCDPHWCSGPLGSIESNGWVYSAHCAFHIFKQPEAWECVGSRWVFFWGDSNHQDTIRNLLNFVLGLDVGTPSRTFDAVFQNPENSNQTLRITSIFGGHYQESENNLGLASLYHEPYRLNLQSYFTGSEVPDFVVINSGLHDGKKWTSLGEYVQAAEFAAKFWEGVWDTVQRVNKPKVIFRSTVAPAGESRSMPANPQKMETFNKVLVDRLLSTRLPLRVVDAYDMTFPWHFDNNCSDGGHYGRPPARDFWFGQIGHQYFVDVMLDHVLLNAICPSR